MTKMYTAEVIADSISLDGHRITSVKVIYPHAVHKDMLRHRAHNRNVESFRAQPPEKLIENLRNGGAFRPDAFAIRVKGMGQGEEIAEREEAAYIWHTHVMQTVEHAEAFLEMGIAKQQVNFLLQDLCPLTEIITATDWENFFALRMELKDDGTPVARPEVYKTAEAIKNSIDASRPIKLNYGQLHLPMLTDHEWRFNDHAGNDHFWIYVSAGRCARISFGDFKWHEEDPQVSYARAQKLLQSGHMSPFEQQARPFSKKRWKFVERFKYVLSCTDEMTKIERDEMSRQLEYSGNLHGWVPARKQFLHEDSYAKLKSLSE
jgi:hypothetical protein